MSAPLDYAAEGTDRAAGRGHAREKALLLCSPCRCQPLQRYLSVAEPVHTGIGVSVRHSPAPAVLVTVPSRHGVHAAAPPMLYVLFGHVRNVPFTMPAGQYDPDGHTTATADGESGVQEYPALQLLLHCDSVTWAPLVGATQTQPAHIRSIHSQRRDKHHRGCPRVSTLTWTTAVPTLQRAWCRRTGSHRWRATSAQSTQ